MVIPRIYVLLKCIQPDKKGIRHIENTSVKSEFCGQKKAANLHKYAILIAARNESAVIGNLIDRVLYGYVIDYLSLSFFPPVCNFADYAITIGVILLVVYIFFFSDSFKKKEIRND